MDLPKDTESNKKVNIYEFKILHTFYASWHNGREFNEGRDGMIEYTKTPWRHVELVNEDGSSLTPDDAAEYSANTAKHGTTGFYAVQAIKEDGKLYNVCFVGNGPDSIYNGAHIVHCVNNHERLVDLLAQCSTELAESIEGKYQGILGYPSTDRDYRTDMEIVEEARTLLAALEAEKGGEL